MYNLLSWLWIDLIMWWETWCCSLSGLSFYCTFQRYMSSEVQNLSQLVFAFFAAVNHLSRPLRKKINFTQTGSKGHGLWSVITGFQSILYVSVFQGSLRVIVICLTAVKNVLLWKWLLNFRVQVFVKSAVKGQRYWTVPQLFKSWIRIAISIRYITMCQWLSVTI